MDKINETKRLLKADPDNPHLKLKLISEKRRLGLIEGSHFFGGILKLWKEGVISYNDKERTYDKVVISDEGPWFIKSGEFSFAFGAREADKLMISGFLKNIYIKINRLDKKNPIDKVKLSFFRRWDYTFCDSNDGLDLACINPHPLSDLCIGDEVSFFVEFTKPVAVDDDIKIIFSLDLEKSDRSHDIGGLT